MTRAMLIHASKQWPGVVKIRLWPYAMQMANQPYNTTPRSSHTGKQSPNKIFDISAVNINQKHWKPFGCPVYVLDAEVQGTMGIHPKWDARSQAGIYLGHSPVPDRNVALVLNIHTGYVSPQFHVKFVKAFRTVQQDQRNATWLISSGFTTWTNKVPPNEAIKQQFPNGDIRDHPGKRQMVAVTANSPTRHMMLLAAEQQVPANPASTIPPAKVADEHPVTSERRPQPYVTLITQGQGVLSSLFQGSSI